MGKEYDELSNILQRSIGNPDLLEENKTRINSLLESAALGKEVFGSVQDMSRLSEFYTGLRQLIENAGVSTECFTNSELLEIDNLIDNENDMLRKIARMGHAATCHHCLSRIEKSQKIKQMINDIAVEVITQEKLDKPNASSDDLEKNILEQYLSIRKTEAELIAQDRVETESVFYWGANDSGAMEDDKDFLKNPVGAIVFSVYHIIKDLIAVLSDDRESIEKLIADKVEDLLSIGIDPSLLTKIAFMIKKHL